MTSYRSAQNQAPRCLWTLQGSVQRPPMQLSTLSASLVALPVEHRRRHLLRLPLAFSCCCRRRPPGKVAGLHRSLWLTSHSRHEQHHLPTIPCSPYYLPSDGKTLPGLPPRPRTCWRWPFAEGLKKSPKTMRKKTHPLPLKSEYKKTSCHLAFSAPRACPCPHRCLIPRWGVLSSPRVDKRYGYRNIPPSSFAPITRLLLENSSQGV